MKEQIGEKKIKYCSYCGALLKKEPNGLFDPHTGEEAYTVYCPKYNEWQQTMGKVAQDKANAEMERYRSEMAAWREKNSNFYDLPLAQRMSTPTIGAPRLWVFDRNAPEWQNPHTLIK